MSASYQVYISTQQQGHIHNVDSYTPSRLVKTRHRFSTCITSHSAVLSWHAYRLQVVQHTISTLAVSSRITTAPSRRAPSKKQGNT